MALYQKEKCSIEILTNKSKNISIHINGLNKEICEKIQNGLDEGCNISFFGDYDYFLDVTVDKKV